MPTYFFSPSFKINDGGWLYTLLLFFFSLFVAGRETNAAVRICYSFLKFSFMDFPGFGRGLVVVGLRISSLVFSWMVVGEGAGIGVRGWSERAGSTRVG